MDALMAALVAAAAAQVGDRTAWLAAILADRWRRPGLVIVLAALALAGVSAVAAVGGALIAPRIAPNAKLLMLALALVLQGGGSFFAAKMPDRLDGWRLGAVATSFLGILILAFGDGVQFIVVALAARSDMPLLAAVGATVGSLAVVAPAAILGETAWTDLRLQRVRFAIGIAFVVVGTVLALTALGLV